MKPGSPIVPALVFTSLLLGCAGYDSLLFVTKTNVGMDVDTKPPTAEITIARREGVVTPAYDGGLTPPLLASFQKDGGWFNPGISSIFAGGDAAVVVATLFDGPTPTDTTTRYDGTLCLAHVPKARKWWKFWTLWAEEPVLRNGEARPFYFGTDTAFGLKVAWSGGTGAIPDTLKLGYNRKEFALAPLSGDERACKLTPEADAAEGKFIVHVPSFIASIDNSSKIAKIEGSEISYTQFIAAGSAATALARQQQVRKPVASRIEASAAAIEGAATREGNRNLINPVLAAFKAGTPENRTRILDKAKELEVVPADTTDDDFLGSIAQHEDNKASTDSLKKLNRFVMAL